MEEAVVDAVQPVYVGIAGLLEGCPVEAERLGDGLGRLRAAVAHVCFVFFLGGGRGGLGLGQLAGMKAKCDYGCDDTHVRGGAGEGPVAVEAEVVGLLQALRHVRRVEHHLAASTCVCVWRD